MVFTLLTRLFIGSVIGICGLFLGAIIGTIIEGQIPTLGNVPWGILWGFSGIVVGTLLGPNLVIAPARRLLRKLDPIPTSTLMLGSLGLVFGLTVAALVSVSLSQLPGALGLLLPAIAHLFLGIFGSLLFVSRERILFEGIPALRRAVPNSVLGQNLVLVDTSAIIDGRILDVVNTGFLQNTLGVPRFILDELQHIADSSDSLRRNRGRRGLEILNQLNKDSMAAVKFMDGEPYNGMEADARLVDLAQELRAAIFTTDFNLNRVAEFQGVRVLNVNDLANALRPVVFPGEEMSVRVVQEGKESGQGVAFMEDGTMVVIENGKRAIGNNMSVSVTRVLQSPAGRIIFAQPK